MSLASASADKASGFLISGFSLGAGVTAPGVCPHQYLTRGTSAEPHTWRILFAPGIIPILGPVRRAAEAADFVKMREEGGRSRRWQTVKTDMFTHALRT